MTPEQNLHNAIGEIAYAIAKADGKIQKEEKLKFQSIVAAELRCHNQNFDVADIIFQLLEKDKFIDSQTAYDWAIREIRVNSHYLSPELKNTFIKVTEKIANAFPPVTSSEFSLVEKFKNDIAPIHGDPVYYDQNKK